MKNRLSKRIKGLSTSIWNKVSQIDELKGAWTSGARLDPQILGRLKRSVLVTSTGSSTRIEGARMSDEDIDKFMRGISVQKFEDRDKQEVRGYYELLTNVFDSYQSIPFSESTIKFFHQELLKYVGKDEQHRGEYKKNENKVHMIDEVGQSVGILSDTTPAYLTPKEMQELTEWTQEMFVTKEFHPLVTIANFIVEFLNIHPFVDGNGRISRILTNLLLLQHGYLYTPYVSHEKLVEDNKPDYYSALRQSQKTFKGKIEDIEPWLNFFLNICIEQAQSANSLLNKEQVDKLLSPQQILVWQYIESHDESTPLEISKSTNVPRPTVSQAITKLLRLKKIERIGSGRSTRYRKI